MSLSYRPSPDADPAVVPVSEAHSIDFGSVAPYRRIRSYKNQRIFCGPLVDGDHETSRDV